MHLERRLVVCSFPLVVRIDITITRITRLCVVLIFPGELIIFTTELLRKRDLLKRVLNFELLKILHLDEKSKFQNLKQRRRSYCYEVEVSYLYH